MVGGEVAVSNRGPEGRMSECQRRRNDASRKKKVRSRNEPVARIEDWLLDEGSPRPL